MSNASLKSTSINCIGFFIYYGRDRRVLTILL
nr:MAG TPA: hypothetical protein [Caudoviricetes sp.]